MSSLTIEQAIALALQHHQAGRLAEAEGVYRQVLSAVPAHADALHYLGMIEQQRGRSAPAVELFRKAVALRGDNAACWSNLCVALNDLGKCDDAVAAGREAVRLKADFAPAHFNLGNALASLGRAEEAIAAYQSAIALRPDYAEAIGNIGSVRLQQDRFDDAIAALQEAIRLRPDLGETQRNLGDALVARRRWAEAVTAYRAAVTLRPNDAGAYSNMGAAMKSMGLIDDAMAAYRRALQLRPDLAEAQNNLGDALRDCGKFDEAIELGRAAIRLKPGHAEAHNNLGNVLKDVGLIAEAVEAYREAVLLRPAFDAAHSNLILSMLYDARFGAGEVEAESRRWNERHAVPVARSIRPHENDRDPERRLRIGYVSADFRDHPVGRFLLPVLAERDRERFEVFAYAKMPGEDGFSRELRSQVDHWRDVMSLSDDEAAEMIRRDRIDILVDLSGHTASNQLLVFARRPAPVQVSYLGYPASTGVEAIAARVTDVLTDPKVAGEKLVRLASTAWCFAPPRESPEVPRHDGPVTFGCFNNFAKVTEPMLRVWAAIVRSVPDSRLLLKSPALGSEGTRQRVLKVLAEEDVGAERVELRGSERSHAGHLAMYRRIDIALDTFPYHGTMTTCEALWMGVPVVTLAGETHVSRVGVSLLTNVGLAELVADSRDAYVEIAARLAGDRARLSELQDGLRERLRASPLMDAPRFARNIEAAYRGIWREWCEGA